MFIVNSRKSGQPGPGYSQISIVQSSFFHSITARPFSEYDMSTATPGMNNADSRGVKLFRMANVLLTGSYPANGCQVKKRLKESLKAFLDTYVAGSYALRKWIYAPFHLAYRSGCCIIWNYWSGHVFPRLFGVFWCPSLPL